LDECDCLTACKDRWFQPVADFEKSRAKAGLDKLKQHIRESVVSTCSSVGLWQTSKNPDLWFDTPVNDREIALATAQLDLSLNLPGVRL
jgi:hypothetical protein